MGPDREGHPKDLASTDMPPPRAHTPRWESGALAHAVTDPFGQGPLPWLRGSERTNYVPVDLDPVLASRLGGETGAAGGVRS